MFWFHCLCYMNNRFQNSLYGSNGSYDSWKSYEYRIFEDTCYSQTNGNSPVFPLLKNWTSLMLMHMWYLRIKSTKMNWIIETSMLLFSNKSHGTKKNAKLHGYKRKLTPTFQLVNTDNRKSSGSTTFSFWKILKLF